MDIGSSTGGFTDCAIQNGAKEVIAIDVGTDVMDKNLRKNKKVKLYENTNIKDLSNILFKNLDYILIDVSFLSLIGVFEKLQIVI
jgi:23S rRNA (cytidine1920-2'-O)/16S rRNA (cytidine1409-2'-O)-methyltransferase